MLEEKQEEKHFGEVFGCRSLDHKEGINLLIKKYQQEGYVGLGRNL